MYAGWSDFMNHIAIAIFFIPHSHLNSAYSGADTTCSAEEAGKDEGEIWMKAL